MAFHEPLARLGDGVVFYPQDYVGLIDLDQVLGGCAPDTAVYCCGPEPLLRAVEQRCDEASLALHVERFAARIDLDAAESSACEVRLAQSDVTLTVPAGRSVLDAIEDAGIQLLSSCREGTCGTCEVPVIEGDVDHRDSLFTPEERAAGESMFVCVSRARSPRLVLDL